MRTDARSIFVASLLLFVLVTGWRIWMGLQPRVEVAPPATATDPPKLAPFRPLGVMNLISNQFSAQTLVVPVNPFRPTFEAMVKNAGSDLEAMVAGQGPNGQRPPPGVDPAAWLRNFARQNPQGRQDGRRPDPGGRRPPVVPDDGPPPIPQYAFKGMFKRTDGHVAAYVTSTVGAGRFLLQGDRLGGCEVLEATADGILLRLGNGTTRLLAQGEEPVALEAE